LAKIRRPGRPDIRFGRGIEDPSDGEFGNLDLEDEGSSYEDWEADADEVLKFKAVFLF
jgi:hypothetical protein